MSHLQRILSVTLAAGLIMAAGIFISFLPSFGVQAASLKQPEQMQTSGSPVAIYFFWGDGCPHCAAAKPFLEELGRQYPNVEVRAFEVWYNEKNQQLFLRMAGAYGFEPSSVPTIFIGDRYWVGYSDPIRAEIEAVVAACSSSGCRDAGLGVMPGMAVPTPAAQTPAAGSAESNVAPNPNAEVGASGIISIPLIGTVNLSTQSLALSTVLIAFVDGFNPCSLWALSVLLALTLHTGSRKKVFLVGIVFLTVTSLVYMLFITGLFTMFTVVSFVGCKY
jgi:glutaredoxin